MAELATLARQAEADWLARDFAREALTGATADGSAFAHYRQALERTQAVSRAGGDRLRELRCKPAAVPPAEAVALLEQYAPAVAAMRAGAHCRDARPEVDWRAGFSHRVTNLLVARDLVQAAVSTAQRLRAAGKDVAAVELLLDAATFGSDLMHSPTLIDQMIGAALTTIATGEAWDDASLKALSPAARQVLADGLARLDARCPTTLDLAGESLLFANAVQHFPPTYEASAPAWLAWRQGFSLRLAAAEAVLFQTGMAAELAGMAALPWPQRERHIDALLERGLALQNPILAIALPNLASAEQNLRLVSAHVRLLRCAVALHRGESVPQLDDPLAAGPLGCDRVGAAVHLRSVGLRSDRPVERVVAVD